MATFSTECINKFLVHMHSLVQHVSIFFNVHRKHFSYKLYIAILGLP